MKLWYATVVPAAGRLVLMVLEPSMIRTSSLAVGAAPVLQFAPEDQSLLDDRKPIPPDNREALLEAEGRGLLISIASGRMISRIETIERQLGIDSVIISYNGGKLWGRRSEGRPLIAHQPLAVDVAEHLIRYSREQGYPLNFYHEDPLFAESSPSRSSPC